MTMPPVAGTVPGMSSSFSYREWYQLNGQRLNEQRRARYHSESGYRRRVLKNNQESRQRRKDATQPKKKGLRARSNPHRWKTVQGVVDGRTETLFTIGALAETLNCSIQVIRLWERQKIIPKTPLRAGKGNKGDRLYTQDMVNTIRTVLTAKGKLPVHDPREAAPRVLLRWVRFKTKAVKQLKLVLIGELARQVGRNVATLEQLESRGFLPETPFRVSSVGRRLYTESMIKTVREAFVRRGGEIRGDEAWKEFHGEVLAGWRALGVMGAVLLQAAPRKKQVSAHGPAKKVESEGTGATLPN